MSIALTEAVEALHIAAARKLLELLETEKDTGVLAKLIATASRFKLPRPATPRASAPPSAKPSAPESASQPAALGQTDTIGNSTPAPPLHPYTEEEYRELVKQHGTTEACAMSLEREKLVWLQRRGNRSSTSSP